MAELNPPREGWIDDRLHWLEWGRRSGERPHPVFADLDSVVEDLREPLAPVPEPILRAKAQHDTAVRSDGTRVFRFDRAVLRGVTAPDARPYLPRIVCPVLLARGQESHVMRPEAAKEMGERIPRASLVEIPGSVHWPQLQNPDAFARAVLGFLERALREPAPGRA